MKVIPAFVRGSPPDPPWSSPVGDQGGDLPTKQVLLILILNFMILFLISQQTRETSIWWVVGDGWEKCIFGSYLWQFSKQSCFKTVWALCLDLKGSNFDEISAPTFWCAPNWCCLVKFRHFWQFLTIATVKKTVFWTFWRCFGVVWEWFRYGFWP